jgi:hypothetical protein
MLHPESRGRNREFAMPRETRAMCDGEEWDTVKINFAEARLFAKPQIGNHVSSFVCGEAYNGTCKERSNAASF